RPHRETSARAFCSPRSRSRSSPSRSSSRSSTSGVRSGMADQSRVPEPTELVYVPGPSWAPAFTAVGVAALAIGVFTSVIISIAGAVVLFWAVTQWFRSFEDQTERLPRRQRTTSTVLPPISVQQDED